MKTRILATLMVLMLLVGMLAGCQSGNSNATTTAAATTADAAAATTAAATTAATTAAATTAAATTAAATTAATTAVPTEERYTYNFGMSLSAPPDEDSMMELYWEDRFNIDLNIIYYEGSNYSELLNLDIAAGNTPDVFSVNSRDSLLKFYKEGVLGAFTEEYLMEKAPAMYTGIVELMGERALPLCEVDGMLYALPAYNPDYDYPSPVIWNLDWLEAVGYEGTPTSLEDFTTVLYAFHNDDPDGNGVQDTYGFSETALGMFFGAYGSMISKWLPQSDGTVKYDIAQEGASDALALLAQFYKDGVLDPEYITGENNGGYWAISHSFGEQRIGLSGMGSYYHWVTPDAQATGISASGTPTIIAELDEPFDFGFGNAPVGPDGKSGTAQNDPLAVICGFSAELVADDARFAKFLNVQETICGFNDTYDYLTCFYGIEGETWDYDENGLPQYHSDLDTVAARCALGCQMGKVTYNPAAYKAMNQNRFDWIAEVYTTITPAGYLNCLTSSLPSATDYQEEANQILTDAKVDIITGVQPIEYYDEAIEDYMAAGGKILTEEATELYNAG